MFKLASACLICCLSIGASAQNINNASDKKSSYGFNIGLNYSYLLKDAATPTDVSFANDLGFRLGVLANYKISRFTAISPKAELAFYNSSINFSETQNTQPTYHVMPMAVEVMTHFVFRDDLKVLSPYFLIGPNVRIPLNEKAESTTDFGTGWDIAIDFGIGLEKAFKHFRFAPELRYSYGFRNVNQHPKISALQLHNVVLVFNLRG
jgi:hypothetical protein